MHALLRNALFDGLLAGWTLPECFLLLRRRLEAERDGDGTREYIRVLRLLEKYPLAQVRPAVEQGLKAGALTDRKSTRLNSSH